MRQMSAEGELQTPQRRVLLITYHFPPSSAVGGMRMANFARWLPSCGWEPSVLTIRDEDAGQLDAERLKGLEGVRIRKMIVIPTVSRLYGAMRTRWVRRRKDAHTAPAAMPSPSRPATRGDEGVTRRLKRYVLSFLDLPDFERGWIVPAVFAAVGEIRRRRIGWIVTTCPPYSTHLVGLAAKWMTGVRWVADFRDPWMTTGSKRLFQTSAASIRLERWLERMVVETSDLCVFNVERLRDAYRERYRHLPADRFVFIPNGITPRTPSPTGGPRKYDTFTLAYTGALYLGRSPEPVLRALARLIAEGKLTPESVRMKLVGQCRMIDGVPTATVARKYGLETVVEVLDQVPHADAVDMISRSHLALLFAPNLAYQIPAKVYDYLGTGTRILAIAEDGGTADLIRETDCGGAFSPEDIDGIASFIHREMMSQHAAREPAASLDRFEVRTITRQLAGYLEREPVGARMVTRP